VTKALLCIACEDAQRALNAAGQKKLVERMLKTAETELDSDDSTEMLDSWMYSTPITVRQFLNSLFRRPRKPDKRERSDTVASETAAKVTKDSVPAADDSFTDEFLLPALQSSETRHLSQSAKKDKIPAFLEGKVFFNHWIRTEEVLRPSMLVKAWNRNAALMCKDGATGIDFVIPVMRYWSHALEEATHLGNCTTGKWTDDQQSAASQVISYILIQTKTRASSTNPERVSDMAKAVPLGPALSSHANFVQHEPRHPFLSLLFDFRVEPARRDAVELLFTVSELEAAHKLAKDKAALLKKVAAASAKDPAKEAESQKASDAANNAQLRVNIVKQQIPIVSFGLDGKAFKCLETRPRLAQKLQELLEVSIDPLDKLEGPLKMELLESRVCISGEGESGDELPETD
jgi:hypothetical protein